MGFQLVSSRLHYEMYLNTFNLGVIRRLLESAGVDLHTVKHRVRMNVETDMGEMLPISLGDVFKGVNSGWMITENECRTFVDLVAEHETALRAVIMSKDIRTTLEDHWNIIKEFINFCTTVSTCNGFYLSEKYNPQTSRGRVVKL